MRSNSSILLYLQEQITLIIPAIVNVALIEFIFYISF